MNISPAPRTVRDQLNSTTVHQAQIVAFKLLDAISGESQGDQLAGITMLFLMMNERYKQDPRHTLQVGSHVLYESLSVGRGEHTRAIKQFLNMEIKD